MNGRDGAMNKTTTKEATTRKQLTEEELHQMYPLAEMGVMGIVHFFHGPALKIRLHVVLYGRAKAPAELPPAQCRQAKHAQRIIEYMVPRVQRVDQDTV